MERRSRGIVGVIALVVMAPVLQGCALLLMRQQPDESPPPPVVSPVPLPLTSALPSLVVGDLATPDQLAALLTPDDFTAVGLEGAGPPSYDPAGEPGNVYAVYAGRSGADGGIEVDIFASGTAEDAASLVIDPGLFAVDAGTKAAMGAERATLDDQQPTNDGTSTYDTLWVQKGRLASAISIPTSERSHEQLVTLATLLLSRSTSDQ